jgi:hypothetical protein
MGVRHETPAPMATRRGLYWQGYRSGKMLAADETRDYEGEIRLEVALVESRTNPRRAFHLGELRGYRDARGDRPVRPVTPPASYLDAWKRQRQAELQRITQEAMRASNAGAWDEA